VGIGMHGASRIPKICAFFTVPGTEEILAQSVTVLKNFEGHTHSIESKEINKILTYSGIVVHH
jgi:hypothetical protein